MDSMQQSFKLGRALADVYILSQESVSQEISNEVCNILEKNTNAYIRMGFNAQMKLSPYNIQA